MRSSRFTIVGIGEALYDVFPQREVIGGAPLNAVVHAQQLGQPFDARGVLVSRVGQDAMGQRLLDELRDRGLSLDVMQTDPDNPTGRVYVDLDADGHPTYDIVEHVAWDVIQFDFDLEDLARQCHAICFGSLAQREGQSRNTIYRFLDLAPRQVKLFDVNLRPPYFDRNVLERSCERASIVKLNSDELPVVMRTLRLPAEGDEAQQCETLRKAFKLEWVVLTRGALGTAIQTGKQFVQGEPARFDRADDADSVGAGDSVTAAILVGRLLQRPVQQIADYANQVGAFVASQPGATPAMPDEIVGRIRHVCGNDQ